MSLFWIITISVGVLLLSVLLDKGLNPWLAKIAVNKLLADVKAGKKPKPCDYEFEIIFDSADFTVLSLKNIRTAPILMRWNEIYRITAFKRDLFSVDQICLFIFRIDETGIELDEDMKDWSEFAESLPKFLPTCRPLEDLIWKVAQPPFVTNQTDIYSKTITEPKSISA